MALNVGFIVTANPPSVPAGGGPTQVTFEAGTDQGTTQLTADFSLEAGAPFVLAGSTRLGPSPVSAIPRNYSQNLTLQGTGGFVPSVTINVLVSDSSSGASFQRTCPVTIEAPPPQNVAAASFSASAATGGVASVGAGGTGSLGERLRAHRAANDLTQQEVADRVGISRSHVSDIERGQSDPSDEIEQKLENLIQGS